MYGLTPIAQRMRRPAWRVAVGRIEAAQPRLARWMWFVERTRRERPCLELAQDLQRLDGILRGALEELCDLSLG